MNYIKKTIVTLLIAIICGYLFLTMAYSINTDSMINNTKETIEKFETEESYKQETVLSNPYLLDNFTDSLMISQAIYKSDKNPFLASLANDRFSYSISDTRLFIRNYIENNSSYNIISYSRYWHGYLIFLKPMLNFFNYYQIRTINLIIQSFLLFITLLLIYKKISIKASLAFLASILIIAPTVIAKSLQFSSIYYITLISSIFILLKIDSSTNIDNIKITFLIIGIFTSFLDLLTAPLLTFGIPMILVLLKRKNIKIIDFILIGINWISGYLLMWLGKWILTSIMLQTDIIKLAFKTISSRTSSMGIVEKISRIDSVIENYKAGLFKNIILINLTVFAVNILLSYKKLKLNIAWHFLILISTVPVLWFLLASNHTSIHYFYTFRIIMISAFALHCLLI